MKIDQSPVPFQRAGAGIESAKAMLVESRKISTY
jgi:hypothetical protein